MRTGNGALGVLILCVFLIIFGLFLAVFLPTIIDMTLGIITGLILIIIGFFFLPGFRIAKEWDRYPILRLGRYLTIFGPGPFYIIPIIESAPFKIDLRIIVLPFRSEQTLTKDNVPVTIDAVLYSKVVDPTKAVLNVQEYIGATNWGAQTSLREVIGKNDLDTVLSQRDTIGSHMREIIDLKTEHWGVAVTSVEIKDVIIPTALQDAMARNAQAERERRARVTLATAEVEAAQKIVDAAKLYGSTPHGLELRWMNILYELGFKGGTIMLVPTKMPEAGYVAPVGLLPLDSVKKSEKQQDKGQ